MSRFEQFQIEVKETFPKQTYRNRASIMTASGVRHLIVPVVRANGNHTRTEDMVISGPERWNIVHLRTIAAAYGASPYYLYYKDNLEAILTKHHASLVSLNGEILDWVFRCLKIASSFTVTNDFVPVGAAEDDYRMMFSPKIPFNKVSFQPYYQVFMANQPFAPNLSVLDLIMNLGPEAGGYVNAIASQM